MFKELNLLSHLIQHTTKYKYIGDIWFNHCILKPKIVHVKAKILLLGTYDLHFAVSTIVLNLGPYQVRKNIFEVKT